MGVKKAIAKATEEPIGKRCVIGSLVHNQNVIERVKNSGIEFVQKPDSSFDEVVVSAHGISKALGEDLKGYNVIDATCERVWKIIEIAKEIRERECLFMVGDIEHSEVKNVASYAKNFYVANKKGVEKESVLELIAKPFDRISVVFQTTVSKKVFDEYVEFFDELSDPRIIVHNTICPSVQKRIDESVKIAKENDLMIVVGDRLSANCTLLFEECKKANINTLFLSNESELPKTFPEKIGITAGASTDPNDVEKIVKAIEQIRNK